MSLATLETVLAGRRHCPSPFLMLGDPTPDLSVNLARAAVAAGASMLELGIPYSDPCADGPVIQRACLRARAAGTTVGVALDVMARIASACPGVPMNLLVYGNLVHARGYQRFCADAAAAGAATVLAPDSPLEEADPLTAACTAAGLGIVHMVAPLTPPERLQRLDSAASGFLYLAAHQGVTGAPGDPAAERRALVARTVAAVGRPVCLGFGLSTPSDLGDAFSAGASIAVVGSHLARAIESAWRNGKGTPDEVLAGFGAAFAPLAVADDQDGDEPCS